MYPPVPIIEHIKFNNQTKKTKKLLDKLQIVKNIASDTLTGYGNLTYV